MKSAKPAAADASSHRRSQPVRQARTNPPRHRAFGDRDADASDPIGDQPIDIFPAVTHFADTMTALPKELVRHFTLLKEVDAKIFGPEEQLFKLVAAATNPAAVSGRNNGTDLSVATPSAPGATSGSAAQEQFQNPFSAEADGSFPSAFDLSSLPRQQLLRQTSYKIHEMLVSLEEKNHVLSTANEALQKQLTRIEDVWPYLEDEFTDEAKWGSTTHWAYQENRTGKASHAERTRRDGAAAISAAAQALADEAAARSDARKQAVQAKKSLKNSHLESDFDDHDGKANRGEGGKKSKARKTAEAAGVGLGITGAAGTNLPPKKRKVERGTNGGAAAERAMAGALGGANQQKAKTNSPRGTPAPDGPKKRKALPSASGQAKKSKNGPAGMSPSITSSPVMPSLPEPKTAPRASPAPNAAPRPPSSRSRQNSLHSVANNGKGPQNSATASKTNGQVAATPDQAATVDTALASGDPKLTEKATAPVKGEVIKKNVDNDDKGPTGAPTSKKEPKVEEPERKNEPTPPIPPITTVTTKSGRASKPSTPALATFQEASRSRPSRSEKDNGVGGSKKGHKKSGSTVQQAPQPPPPPRVPEEDATSSAQGDDDDGDIDADEPRYCYCNQVSYGEMVACDSDDCPREWFHLQCVGLKTAPNSKAKWYCVDCRERLKGAKRTNGR
ncbi:PHD-finger domain-containing protein [Sarocladium implicatum]|nr:PHD-finger domain-containing protein [Sarocladium implicatum]